ncbi:Glycosyl transferase family 2 [Flavobacterium resistens]|uniref:Glycosyl transferase family 2 n=1 Tax=Flavobacterium resistens TaxID=443612 RepID=A0A521FAM6_9FLAO|nr:glycosyltransferase family 2 protein [Flavobacterium resistens]MRX70501.1 hypothetical protein [Flavobacterium resistens]SMO93252.1 Glycosyl transferase family 2 [Flavobacterium resistens]
MDIIKKFAFNRLRDISKIVHYIKRKKSVKKLKKVNFTNVPDNKDEIRLFAIMRNEELRLPYFFEYYKKIGVDRFFIIDNNSSDNSVSIASKNDNVHIYSTTDNFKNFWFWMEYLLKKFGSDQWCLVVDIDELFAFPYSEKLKLADLINFLEKEESTSIRSFLLDMYSEKSIKSTHYNAGENPLLQIPFFDSSYETGNFRFIDKKSYSFFDTKSFTGGMRKRVFGDISIPHVLSKISLFKNQKQTYLTDGMHAINNSQISNIQGAVFHTKFLFDFIEEVNEEIKREQHFRNAFYYKHYEKEIAKTEDINLYCESSVKYIDTNQLINLGIMATTASFDNYAQFLNKEK